MNANEEGTGGCGVSVGSTHETSHHTEHHQHHQHESQHADATPTEVVQNEVSTPDINAAPPKHHSGPADDENSNSSDAPSPKKYTSVQGVGISHDRNARFRRTMEDEHVIVDNFGGNPDQGYFAIYDGHGGRGAVDFTAKTLHKNLLEELKDGNENVGEALTQAYLKTDKQMGDTQIQFSGTTSISVLIRKNKNGERWLYCANAGDARAVLCRNGVAERLSYDHKGSDEAETKRIVDAGGFVVLNRVNGILAVTRSLGDHAMKDYVTGLPYLKETKLDASDTHLILACDGLWDVATDQEAVDLILNENDAQKMSDKLLVHALKNGSTDNISVMTVIL